MAIRGLSDTTIRDFGGGWNVADSDLNLNSRYQPISDNVCRGIDGSFFPRQGNQLFTDFATGTETSYEDIEIDIETTLDSVKVEIKWTAHGFASGEHIMFTAFENAVGGYDPDDFIGKTFGIIVVDADNFFFYMPTNATSTDTDTIDISIVHDDHLIGGNIIHQRYFNRRLVNFTDMGEVGTVDINGTMARIWGITEAEALSTGLVPTRQTERWSADTFKSTMIACNGYDRDKPIQIMDDFAVEFLVDKATFSNAAVPKADHVVCLQGYVVFIRTEWGDPFVEFSARGTDGTFTREANPADAAEVDLSMVTATGEPVLLGGAPIRDKLYVAFYDKGMIGTLGIYDSNGAHVPDFADTVAENGTISHRTIVPLGNDIFMCDYAGVPSVSISQQSGIFVPVRLSELISPSIQAHLSSLNEEILRKKAFAFFNQNDRSYMLFVPMYDDITRNAEDDPFVFNTKMNERGWALFRARQHNLFEGSYINIAGSTDIGALNSATINARHKIIRIVDKDNVVIDMGGSPINQDITSGGGSSVTYTPISDEMIGYIFEYNKEFKIRRWTRYRGWNFDTGCASQRGRIFFAKGKKVYRMSDNEISIYADFVGDYDVVEWEAGATYPAGTRFKLSDPGGVWYSDEEIIGPSGGDTIADLITSNGDHWFQYTGTPINWELETPWSDLRQRARNKTNHYINIDSEGNDRFTVTAFVNKIRFNPSSYELEPAAEMDFQAGDTGGWGIQVPGNFGGGRRTREEKVWPFKFRGKLIRWRFSGSTTRRVRIMAHTMYYKMGNIR